MPHPYEYGDLLGPLISDCAVSVVLALLDPESRTRPEAARRAFLSLMHVRGTCKTLRAMVETGIDRRRYIAHFHRFIGQRPYPLNSKIPLLGPSNVWVEEILATVRTDLFCHCSFCGRRPAPVYPRLVRRICGRCYPARVIPYEGVRSEYGLNEKQMSRLKFLVPFNAISLQVVRIQRSSPTFRFMTRFRPASDFFLEESTTLLFLREDVEANLFRV